MVTYRWKLAVDKTWRVIHPDVVTYHHGDLRTAILQATADAVLREGVHAVNLRGLARDVGVSHTAPRYHFGDKRGVITALAAQGYAELARCLGVAASHGSFLDVGVAYVEYALSHPAHYQVLFQPDLVDADDQDLCRARAELFLALTGADASPMTEAAEQRGSSPHPSDAAIAAWSIAHGFATLALSGAVKPAPGEDLLDLARRSLRTLGV